MKPTITYAITVCNEHRELGILLSKLRVHLRANDQVLIQSDSDNVTPDVLGVIMRFIMASDSKNYVATHISTPLNGDFGAFKNNLKLNASGDWIFQIDADEYPTESLLMTLHDLILENIDIDVIHIPRINTVRGITREHVNRWGWKVDVYKHPLLVTTIEVGGEDMNYLRELGAIVDGIGYYKPIINFPDYQTRLYQNKPNIHWVNTVHERLVGFDSYAQLPLDIVWCLMHHKDIGRQEKQNSFYNTIIHAKD